MMKCPVCGHENKNEGSFCQNCGALIPTPEAIRKQKIANGFLAFAKLLAVVGMYLGTMTAVTFVWMVKYIITEGGATFDMTELMAAFNRDSEYINILYVALCVLGTAVFYKIRKKSLVDAANIYPASPFKIGTALVCGFAAQLPLGVLVGLIPFSEETIKGHDELMGMTTMSSPVMILYVVVLAPIIEEIFFRGIAHDRLSKNMHPLLASVISSAAFALIHGETIAIIAAFAAGMLLSILYNRYRTVLVPIAFHMGFNSLAYAVPLIEGLVLEIVAICVSTVLFLLGLVILLKKDKAKKNSATE